MKKICVLSLVVCGLAVGSSLDAMRTRSPRAQMPREEASAEFRNLLKMPRINVESAVRFFKLIPEQPERFKVQALEALANKAGMLSRIGEKISRKEAVTPGEQQSWNNFARLIAVLVKEGKAVELFMHGLKPGREPLVNVTQFVLKEIAAQLTAEPVQDKMERYNAWIDAIDQAGTVARAVLKESGVQRLALPALAAGETDAQKAERLKKFEAEARVKVGVVLDNLREASMRGQQLDKAAAKAELRVIFGGVGEDWRDSLGKTKADVLLELDSTIDKIGGIDLSKVDPKQVTAQNLSAVLDAIAGTVDVDVLGKIVGGLLSRTKKPKGNKPEDPLKDVINAALTNKKNVLLQHLAAARGLVAQDPAKGPLVDTLDAYKADLEKLA